MDETRLNAFMGKLVNDMGGAAMLANVIVGEELGLYRAMADSQPVTPQALAEKTTCNPRLVREWHGITHQVLSRHHSAARIEAIELDGSGDIIGLILDNHHDEGAADSLAGIGDLGGLADLAGQGVSLAAVIVRSDLSQVTGAIEQVAATTRRIAFTSPIDATAIARQNLVFIGEAATVTGRFLVRDVAPAKRFTLRVQAVPEAPGLWS